MAAVSGYADTSDAEAKRKQRREAFHQTLNKISGTLGAFGLGFLIPIIKLCAGESPAEQLRALWIQLFVPLIGIAVFLLIWAYSAPQVQTSLGAIPGPTQVWEQAVNLHKAYLAEGEKEKAFNERQEKRNARLVEQNKQRVAEGKEPREIKIRQYTGAPTYYSQIWKSIQTVALGFIVATVFAVPLGIMCGLSSTVNGALNPLIQIFKPVSPLAWLPIVTMVVSAAYAVPYEWLPKAMLISAITVTLCSLWPTLINTALGVSSIDKDLLNVGKVLRLPTWQTITKIVLPSSLPLIFTGMRLSLGVGWMVLIAAEMLAQNPGLGKFVWDEFQNGSSQSLAKIMVAVITIGLIGFLLDRIMYALQAAFTFSINR